MKREAAIYVNRIQDQQIDAFVVNVAILLQLRMPPFFPLYVQYQYPAQSQDENSERDVRFS